MGIVKFSLGSLVGFSGNVQLIFGKAVGSVKFNLETVSVGRLQFGLWCMVGSVQSGLGSFVVISGNVQFGFGNLVGSVKSSFVCLMCVQLGLG